MRGPCENSNLDTGSNLLRALYCYAAKQTATKSKSPGAWSKSYRSK